jgi:hypothetical protein
VNRESSINSLPAIDCNADQIFSLGEKALKGRHIPAMGNAHRRRAKCESTAVSFRETSIVNRQSTAPPGREWVNVSMGESTAVSFSET